MSENRGLYQGKRKDNGEWVEGFCVCINNRYHFIFKENLVVKSSSVDFVYYEVIPESVGQFTGRTDKNGVKIFSGNIFFVYGEYDNGLYDEDRSGYAYVDYCVERACYALRTISGEWLDTLADYLDFGVDNRELQVVGNIYDNPDLLNGSAKE